ncbi:MAG: hypothetical protein AAF235_08975 [Planctomycetota bacterium]
MQHTNLASTIGAAAIGAFGFGVLTLTIGQAGARQPANEISPSDAPSAGPWESVVFVIADDPRQRPRPMFADDRPVLIHQISVSGGELTVFDGPGTDPVPTRQLSLLDIRGTAIAHVESDLAGTPEADTNCQTVVLPLDVVARNGAYLFSRADAGNRSQFRATILYRTLD